MDKVEKKKYLKRLEAKKKSRRRRVKRFLDFRKSEPKTSKFNSTASSPLPGPMSVGRSLGTGPGSVEITSQTSN
jgi:hypothetical protein